MISKQIIDKYYSNIANDNQLFKEAILQRVTVDMTILDAGAGNGRNFDISFLKGKCKAIIGVDIDESIKTNNHLDQRIQASLDKIPLPNNSVDLIYSRYVFEHLQQPDQVVHEFSRILKRNGYAIILTPNKYHYVPLLSRISPHSFHKWVNSKRGRCVSDTFPTYYKCNTANTLKLIFEGQGFESEGIILHEGVPNYLLWNNIFFWAVL